jgi:hypothetical protein
VQASENAKRLSDAEEQIVAIGAPEREVHVQRFAREQLQMEYEEFKTKVAEQQQRYERDIRLAQSNLTTRAGADASTKESMREQLLSLRATVADLRATNSKLIVENAAQAAKLATIESGAPITDAEAGDFDSPFFRGAPKSKSSKPRDTLAASQTSSALPSARFTPPPPPPSPISAVYRPPQKARFRHLCSICNQNSGRMTQTILLTSTTMIRCSILMFLLPSVQQQLLPPPPHLLLPALPCVAEPPYKPLKPITTPLKFISLTLLTSPPITISHLSQLFPPLLPPPPPPLSFL